MNSAQLGHAVFAPVLAELTSTHAAGNRYAMIAEAINDTITLTHLAVTQHH